MAATTTVKVTPTLRDRINGHAKASHVTPAGFLERLVEEYEKREWFASIKAAYEDQPITAEDQAETDLWDVTLADGIDRG